jgi:hypothetical protein
MFLNAGLTDAGLRYARNNHAAMQRLQKSQLYNDEEQEEEPGPPGAEEILSVVPSSHAA